MRDLTEMSRDAWKYTSAPKPEELKGNRYLHPPDADSKTPIPNNLPISKDGFITIGPIACYDSTGRPFEEYDKLEIAGNLLNSLPEAHSPPSKVKCTPLSAISFFEGEQQFLPSFALTCASLLWLFEHGNYFQAKSILSQYSRGEDEYIYQNTIIRNSTIFHYPSMLLSNKTNKTKNEVALGFKLRPAYSNRLIYSIHHFEKISLCEALNTKDEPDFLRNLTGLKDPSILEEITMKCFAQTCWVKYPLHDAECGTLIGNGNNLFFNLAGDLLLPARVRGVRLPK